MGSNLLLTFNTIYGKVKRMSRPLRIEFPGAWHHVMNRARHGSRLFRDTEDYTYFLELLQHTAKMFNIRVSAYCFMPNHYHLLIQTPDMNLSRCMRHLNGVFTQKYNRRHQCDGTLFRGRYKSILVEEDRYLLQLLRYIHQNPLQAGMVERLDRFQWSSHNGYVSRAKKWDWLHKDFLLSMLTSNRTQQIKQYKRFVSAAAEQEILQIFENKSLPSLLGTETFVKRVRREFFEEKRNREIPASKSLAPDTKDILKTVCEFYKINDDQIYSVKRGTENEPRNVAIYLMRILRGDPLMKIGAAFNLAKHSSVGSAIERTEKKLGKNRKFKNRVKEIRSRLIKGQKET